MKAILDRPKNVSVLDCCEALGVSRATLYRVEAAEKASLPPPESAADRPPHFRALSKPETAKVLDVLTSERFCEDPPREVYAALLDENQYLCSISTMYRILWANAAVKERRNQLRHPAYCAPELLATKPNQVWSWDITKLKGPEKWRHFHLYVILDIFSRYVVGWMVANRESSKLAVRLIEDTCKKQSISSGELTLHADRGSSMKSKPVAYLLADLGVTKTHSRPHVSDDNPYSESQFKTMKYRPEFPERFGSLQDARSFGKVFFPWYNTQHHHSGIGLHTPENLHYGRAAAIDKLRLTTLSTAFALHPERFVKRNVTIPQLPSAAWINPPKPCTDVPTSIDSALH
jgi:putative transposase